jgi:hypothetical protein
MVELIHRKRIALLVGLSERRRGSDEGPPFWNFFTWNMYSLPGSKSSPTGLKILK